MDKIYLVTEEDDSIAKFTDDDDGVSFKVIGAFSSREQAEHYIHYNKTGVNINWDITEMTLDDFTENEQSNYPGVFVVI